MGGFRRMAAVVLVLVGASWVPMARAESVTTSPPPRAESDAAQLLVAPVLWMLGTLGVPVDDPAPLPNSTRLEREQGWRDLEYPVHDLGLGVFLELRGRVEFARAQIRFSDGSVRPLALGHAVRGRGLYQLADFEGMTSVDAVLLSARARSSEAQIGVRLGR